MEKQIEKSWTPFLKDEFKKNYTKELMNFLDKERASGKKIYPDEKHIFKAFELTPFNKVKVVILGQDPYHGPQQAHGLSFSVRKGIKIPPSLINIFKELKNDTSIDFPSHGCLESWTKQGVLLLNAVLTVENGRAGSHHNKGWEKFTDKVIEVLNTEKENLVFILWGDAAQKKAVRVDPKKHLLLKSVHPSPLSCYRGFLGSKPFSQTNVYLEAHGIQTINWNL
jgi:uracil-DNA glycosylase